MVVLPLLNHLQAFFEFSFRVDNFGLVPSNRAFDCMLALEQLGVELEVSRGRHGGREKEVLWLL
jgi:hypothetical protein